MFNWFRPPKLQREVILDAWIHREENADAYDLLLSTLDEEEGTTAHCYYRAEHEDFVLRHSRRTETADRHASIVDEEHRADPRYRLSAIDGPNMDPEDDAAMVADRFVIEPMGRFKQHPAFDRPRIIGAPGRMYTSLPLRTNNRRIGIVISGPFVERKVARQFIYHRDEILDLLGVCFDAASAHEKHRRKLSDLERSMASTKLAMAAALDFGRLIESLLAQAVRASGFSGGFYAPVDFNGRVQISYGYRLPESLENNIKSDLRDSFVCVEDIGGHHILTVREAGLAELGIQRGLLLPIVAEEELKAVIGLVAEHRSTSKDVDALELLGGFASQIALVYARERQMAEFGASYYITLMALCDGLDTAQKQPGHHQRVADLARGIAENLQLSEDQVMLIERAARVHDVGFVPAASLDCSAIEAEFQHPVLGASLTAPLPDGTHISEIIMQHHETHDGYGYPNNLQSSATPVRSQIVAAAEHIIEAMDGNAITAGLNSKQIVPHIREESGRRINGPIADAAIAVFEAARTAKAANDGGGR